MIDFNEIKNSPITLNCTIKQISPQETYPVRHPVLREGQPIESCIFSGDELKTTIHFGLFSNDNLIGVGSFFKNKNDSFYDADQFQLRGMGVLKEFQGKGLGQLFLEYTECELKKMKITLLWCNARETAANFYKKCGFQITGQPFDIESIGIHYVMHKKL